MAGVAAEVRSRGIPCELVSVGSTPGLAGLEDAATFAGRPDIRLVRLSEESGWIESGEAQLRVGERLRVVPNHACELTNLAEVVFYGEGETIEGVWRPVARGKVW